VKIFCIDLIRHPFGVMTNDFSGGLRGLRPPATFWQPVNYMDAFGSGIYLIRVSFSLSPGFDKLKLVGHQTVSVPAFHVA